MTNLRVTTAHLNVRKGPSLSEAIVNLLDEGDVVAEKAGVLSVGEVEEPDSSARTWMRIDSPGAPDGWASLKNFRKLDDGRFEVNGTAGANIRPEPTLAFAAIGHLGRGELVPFGALVSESTETEGRRWARLDLPDDKSGWASMRCLASTSDPVSTSTREYRVTASVLNVREGPSLGSEVVGTLSNGALVPEGEIVTTPTHRWMRISNPDGFISMKWLTLNTSVLPGTFPWYAIARGEIGVREHAGAADNPRIVEYHRTTTLPPGAASEDETAWCSSFVNWCMEKAGIEGTDNAWARSWLNFGYSVSTPLPGTVAVFSRGPDWGHVGFFVSRDGNEVRVLGGNQSDAVNIKGYAASRLLGYRMPHGF
jgi:uncharacterized protein (TIGR02594 family)